MADSSHQGQGNIRRLLDSFEVASPHGKHTILVFEPAQMSLRDMKLVFRPDGFDEDFVRGAIIELLKALDYLHAHGEVVHTGIVPSPARFLLGLVVVVVMDFVSPLMYCRCAPWKHALGHL